MVVLTVLVGLCLSKPPEATRLATTASFGLPRCASSYLPRKQQRVRVFSTSLSPLTAVRACHRAPHAIALPHRSGDATWTSGLAAASPIRLTADRDSRPHPLRC